jgi:ATP-dependent DNA ligase
MLASTAISPRPGEYAFEPKLDGWRVIVHVRDGVRVFTRPGSDATQSLPEFAALAGAVPDGTAPRNG